MIAFRLNGQATTYDGDPAASLLSYLRNDRRLTAAKDGCSGQAAYLGRSMWRLCTS